MLGRRSQLGEDAHRTREVNALRLDGFGSITEGLAALAHGIKRLLAALGWQEPAQALSSA